MEITSACPSITAIPRANNQVMPKAKSLGSSICPMECPGPASAICSRLYWSTARCWSTSFQIRRPAIINADNRTTGRRHFDSIPTAIQSNIAMRAQRSVSSAGRLVSHFLQRQPAERDLPEPPAEIDLRPAGHRVEAGAVGIQGIGRALQHRFASHALARTDPLPSSYSSQEWITKLSERA
jgi:hypothetical protein